MQIADKQLQAVLLAGNHEDAGSATSCFGDPLRPSHLDVAVACVDRTLTSPGSESISRALTPFFQVALGMMDAHRCPADRIGRGPAGKLDARQVADLRIPQAQEGKVGAGAGSQQVGAASELDDGCWVRSLASRALEKPVAVDGVGDRLGRQAVVGGHEIRNSAIGIIIVEQGARAQITALGVAVNDFGHCGA